MTLVERLEPALDAVEVFRRLAHLPHVVFLDSAVRGGPTGRYSFVAADPIRWWDSPDAFDELASVASRWQRGRPARSAAVPRWPGRHVRLRAGAAVRARARGESRRIPICRRWRSVGTTWSWRSTTSKTPPGSSRKAGPKPNPPPAHRARPAANSLQSELASAQRSRFAHALRRSQLDELAPQHPTGIEHLTSNFSADDYLRAVRRAIDYIYAGDVFQVNLAQRLLHPAHGSPIDLYCRLRERNPAPLAGYLDGGDWQIASASPERFLQRRRPARRNPADQRHGRPHPRRRGRPRQRPRAHRLATRTAPRT